MKILAIYKNFMLQRCKIVQTKNVLVIIRLKVYYSYEKKKKMIIIVYILSYYVIFP